MASNRAFELNGVDDEDAALRQAIAMSLGEDVPEEETGGPSRNSDPADVGNNTTVPSSGVAELVSPPAPTSSMSALGLDRKRMEEERLARLKKRKADSLSDPSTTSTVDCYGSSVRRPRLVDTEPAGLSSAAQLLTSSTPQGDHRVSRTTAKSSSATDLPYPKGTVLRTFALGVPRDNDIKIEEVFQKDDLELAVLSSFQWDEGWLMSKLNLKKTKVLLIAYAADDAQKAEMRDNVPSEVIRFVFPPMENGASFMHSKLQLLKYPKYLRIVVPTGNLVPYDWGETGTMENMAFLIDLPRIEDTTMRKANILTPFGDDLSYFLCAQGVDEKMISSLLNYDFSETSRYGFVHTIAGAHPEPAAWQRTGYCGLGRTIAALGLGTSADVELDYVCSSIGAVNNDLLAALYNACQGDSGIKEYEARTGKPRKRQGVTAPVANTVDPRRLRVYFPSSNTVLRSRGGINSAGTIRFQRKWWNANSFPREILRDSKNVRPGILMHTKMMFVRGSTSSSGDPTPNWVFVGSHNLSESAWGRLVKNRTTGNPKLNARNWECGVVVPLSTTSSPSRSSQLAERATEGPRMLDVFRGLVPVPIELPGVSYQGDERHPYFHGET